MPPSLVEKNGVNRDFRCSGWDALAGVGDGEGQVISPDRGAHGEHSAVEHGLQGILHEVKEYLAYLAGIKGKLRDIVGSLELKDHASLGEAGLHKLRDLRMRTRRSPGTLRVGAVRVKLLKSARNFSRRCTS